MPDGPDAPVAVCCFRDFKVRTIGGLPPDAPRTHDGQSEMFLTG